MAPVIDEYIDLQLIVGSDPDTLSSYSIMCGDREFDYLILANEIYTEVAAYVLRLRRDAATYPVYLTAIAPSSMDDSDAWSTIRLLNFKKRLETQINVAMEKLARERGL
jgi:adenylate cyclase class 1